MRGELTRGKLIAILAMSAVAFGAAAWLLLGPVWTIAGALVGPLLTIVVVAVVRAFTSPDAATLLSSDQPGQAIARLHSEMPSWRTLARIWPSQFRDALANRPPLAECLTCEAGWLAEIELSGDALAAVHEATGICQDKLPWQQLPSCAARAMLLEGELLYGQARHREAARLLVMGWRMAAGQHLQDVLRDATPAIRSAYRAAPDHFAVVWHAETGAEPPDWLTT